MSGTARSTNWAVRITIAAYVAFAFCSSAASGSTKDGIFQFPRERVFAAALAVARHSKEVRMLESGTSGGVITFRADVDEIGPSDRALGDYWTGLAVTIEVCAQGDRDSIVRIEVERVYPARFNNIPQRMSPQAEEVQYAQKFLARIRSELRKSR